MSKSVFKFIEIFFFCFLVMLVQVAVLKEFYGFNFNLAFVCILAFTSRTSLVTSMIASMVFIFFNSTLSYNGEVCWLYLIIAYLGVLINPKSIDDKFLVAIFYCLLFTPVIELQFGLTAYPSRVINNTLINFACLVPLYFLVKFCFAKPKNILVAKI